MRVVVVVATLCGCRFGFDETPRGGDAGVIPTDGMHDAVVRDGAPDALIDAPDGGGLGTCPATYTFSWGGSSYRLLAASTDWLPAEEACETDGAHLVIIDTFTEASAITAVTGLTTIWVGTSDRITELQWRSVDGTTPAYLPWKSAPVMDGPDCVDFEPTTLQIDEQSCSSGRQGVCECDGHSAAAGSY